ncbi:unnamed protein product [Schistosoma turkestanicum]|nr:unnamed protein product [Schistosoma turkestanicum]
MLDVDIQWGSVGNMNATSVSNFHALTYNLGSTEAEETSINESSTGELQNVLGNNLNLCSPKKMHNVKEKRQAICQSSPSEASKQNVATNIVDKPNNGPWNLVKVRVGFDVTRKGERSLVINGYKFTKSRDGMGDRVFWRCSRRECKATAVTVSNKVEHIRSIHSHLPPVAAEFFSNDSSRYEQEVRFNNLVYTQRSRIRRRKQLNPSVKLSKQSITKPCFLEQTKEIFCPTSSTVTSNSASYKEYSSTPRNMNSSNDMCFDASEYTSPMKKQHCSDEVLSNYLTLQTISTLLNKWVDSKQVNIENGEVKNHLSNISKSILSSKKLSNTNLLINENDKLFQNNSISNVNSSSNPTLNNVHEDTLSKVSKLESFKTINTLVTSSNNIYTHNSQNDSMRIKQTSQFITQNDPSNEDENNRNFTSLKNSIINNLSKTHQSELKQFITNSSSIDVSSFENNTQRQLIPLNNEQLNELLKIINQMNSIPIRSESMSSPSLVSSSVNNTLISSSELLTLPYSHVAGGLAQCTTTYCCSHYPRINSRVVNHNNDCCISSFHHICCSSTNPILNPSINSSVNNYPSNLFSTMSKSVTVNGSDVGGCEKIRESVEEGGINSLNELYDNNGTFPHRHYQNKNHGNTLKKIEDDRISVNNTSLTNCSSQIIYHGISNTFSDYSSFSPSSRITYTTNSYASSSSTHGLIPGQSQEMTIQSSNDDQLLSNQIQDGILMKILNTIQQLTAKLDAHVDPPEVIQNCRAIQACLDTITAIRRAKSNQINIDKPNESYSTTKHTDSNDNLQYRECTSKLQENSQLLLPNFIQS